MRWPLITFFSVVEREFTGHCVSIQFICKERMPDKGAAAVVNLSLYF